MSIAQVNDEWPLNACISMRILFSMNSVGRSKNGDKNSISLHVTFLSGDFMMIRNNA